MAERSWSPEEVEAILGRALEREHRAEGALGHEELIDVGRQVGISREALERAAEEVAAERDERRGETALVAVKQELAQRSRRGFVSHLWVYLVVNGALAAMAWLAGAPQWLGAIPALGWGIGVALHLRAALFPDPYALDRRARKEIEKRIKKAKRAGVDPQKMLEDAGRQLGDAVGQGVAVFLATAGERLREGPRPPGESPRRPRARVIDPADEGDEPDPRRRRR